MYADERKRQPQSAVIVILLTANAISRSYATLRNTFLERSSEDAGLACNDKH